VTFEKEDDTSIGAIVMGVREDKSHSAKAPRDEDKDKK